MKALLAQPFQHNLGKDPLLGCFFSEKGKKGGGGRGTFASILSPHRAQQVRTFYFFGHPPKKEGGKKGGGEKKALFLASLESWCSVTRRERGRGKINLNLIQYLFFLRGGGPFFLVNCLIL